MPQARNSQTLASICLGEICLLNYWYRGAFRFFHVSIEAVIQDMHAMFESSRDVLSASAIGRGTSLVKFVEIVMRCEK